MTWKRKTVIKILMLVASMIEEDVVMRKALTDLANHISIHGKEMES